MTSSPSESAADRTRFSRSTISALPRAAPGKRDYYPDSEVRGLVLQVTATGHKSFQFYRKVRGRPERITLGAFDPDMPESQEFSRDRPVLERVRDQPRLNVKKARALAVAVRAALDDGRSVDDIKRAGAGALTLATLFPRFLAERRNKRGEYLSPNTRRGYQVQFSRNLCPLHHLPLDRITRDRVEALQISIGKDRRHTANRALALLSSMFSFAIELRLYRGTNPVKGIRQYAEDHRRRFIHPNDMPAFFAALFEEQSDFRDVILLALLTGARRADVLAMEWAHVQLDRGVWTIPRTKNGEPLSVALTTEAVAVLQQRVPALPAQFVFPGIGQTGHLVELKDAWRRVLKRAGLSGLRFHDLRHTAGGALAATGANIAVSMQALGHKTAAAAIIYQKMDIDPVRRAVETANAAILEAAGLAARADVVPIRRKA